MVGTDSMIDPRQIEMMTRETDQRTAALPERMYVAVQYVIPWVVVGLVAAVLAALAVMS